MSLRHMTVKHEGTMASKVTAKTNSLRGGVHHFLQASMFKTSGHVNTYGNKSAAATWRCQASCRLVTHARAGSTMPMCSAHQDNHIPRSQGPCEECKGDVTHTSTLTECCLQRLRKCKLVQSCKEKCITCPACRGMPAPSDPVVHSQTNLSFQRACKLWCYVPSHGDREVTALLAGCK